MSIRYVKKQSKRWWRAVCKTVLQIYDLDERIHKEVDAGPYRHEWDWRAAHPGVKERLERQYDARVKKWYYYTLKLYKLGKIK